MPTMPIVSGCVRHVPVKGNRAGLAILEGEEARPYLMAKSVTGASRLPPILRLQYTSCWHIHACIVPIEGKAIVLTRPCQGIVQGGMMKCSTCCIKSDRIG